MGLTMAEIMLLVVFCLLLLLAWTWTRDFQGPKDLAAALQQLERASGRRVTVPISEDFLVLVKAGRAAVSALKLDDGSLSDVTVGQIEDAVKLGTETRAAFGPNKMSQPAQVAALEFVKEAGAAYRQANNQEPVGSASIWFQSLQRCATDCGGKGGDFPPCARTADGKAALIFTATLRSTTIELHDNRIPELETARAAWPTEAITFDEELSDNTFIQQTAAMFKWSQERACRFFVDISDETGATEKMAYKNRLRTVERHFYKNESFQQR